MKWLQVARAVLMLMPVLIGAIRAIEEAIPGEGKGEQKLAQLRAILEAAHDSMSKSVVSFEDIWPVLDTAVRNLVVAFNATGWGRQEDEEVV
jgi:hypothetical protein